jgi:hypothetical protein
MRLKMIVMHPTAVYKLPSHLPSTTAGCPWVGLQPSDRIKKYVAAAQQSLPKAYFGLHLRQKFTVGYTLTTCAKRTRLSCGGVYPTNVVQAAMKACTPAGDQLQPLIRNISRPHLLATDAETTMSRNLLATSGFERHASFSKDTALDPVVVDIWLLVYAQTFVGTLASSLTANVASLRKARQKTSLPYTPRTCFHFKC